VLDSHDLLDVCWTNGLDTPCSICKQHFDNAIAPPVRTLRLPEASLNAMPTDTDLPSIKITNAHLHCLKTHNVKLFPVSHAWHEPVARAYASRESNIQAARIVFEIPVRILVAATQRFGPNVQIWHDYISIPQWQDSFRGTTILPQIFQIFKYGGTALIHLDDEPTFDIYEASALQDLVTHAPTLKCLFSARWFRRMWIIVEFMMCRDGYLMNSRFEIMSSTFSSLMKQVAETSLALSTPLDPALDWMTTIPMFSKDRSTHNCLGHVYDLLANQGCRSYRDRFIATCAILEQDGYSRSLAELPQDRQEACLWVSKRALQRNDYSPLLLRPSDEPQHARVRWLKGHTTMDANMWGLGIQTGAAHVPPIILSDDSVELEVHLLGIVTDTMDLLDGEAMLSVQCLVCKTSISSKAYMWQQPKGASKLYRIPGLAYQTSDSGQIGIVVEDPQVIGRARPGLPRCRCNEHIRICIN